MKHFLKFILIFIILVLGISAIYFAYMYVCVPIEYRLFSVDKEYCQYYSKYEKDTAVDLIVSDYNVNKLKAEDIYNHPDKYISVSIECKVENKSIFNIHDFSFLVRSKNKNIITAKDESLHSSLRKVNLKSYSVERVCFLYENTDNFSCDLLNEIKIKAYNFSPIYGLFISKNGTFNSNNENSNNLKPTL